MKAIVAEIDKKQMIVITGKGDFLKVKRQMSVTIGDEIELKPQKTYLTYKRLASMAACFLACIFLSTGVYAYYTPYSYVSVDINPSIALSLNRFERVISVKPLNEDAVSLINDTKNLKNHDIDEALSEIIKSASEKGYINEKIENQVMVVVSAKDSKQEDKLASAVNTAATKELSKVNNNYGVTVERTSIDNYKASIANKVSPGKEILGDKLRAVIPEIKDEEIRNMSVKEAVHLINEGRKAVKASEKDSKDKDEKEQAINNKGSEKQKGKEAEKAAAEAKNNKNNGDKLRPSALKNSNEGKNGNGEGIKAVEENKGEKAKNSEEEQKKKDRIDKAEDKTDKSQIKDKDKNNYNPEGKVNDDKDSKYEEMKEE